MQLHKSCKKSEAVYLEKVGLIAGRLWQADRQASWQKGSQRNVVENFKTQCRSKYFQGTYSITN